MIGKCDSCGKIRTLKPQTNFGVRRSLCSVCRPAADKVERLLAPAELKTEFVRPEIFQRLPHK